MVTKPRNISPNSETTKAKRWPSWSIKNVDPAARALAKEAARGAGLTLGQWLAVAIRKTANRQLNAADSKAASDRSEAAATERERQRRMNRMFSRLAGSD